MRNWCEVTEHRKERNDDGRDQHQHHHHHLPHHHDQGSEPGPQRHRRHLPHLHLPHLHGGNGEEMEDGALVFTLRVEDSSKPAEGGGLKQYATVVPPYAPKPLKLSGKREKEFNDFYDRFY
jgi:hypothetical protein